MIVVNDGGELVTVRCDELLDDREFVQRFEDEINRVLDARSEAAAKAASPNEES